MTDEDFTDDDILGWIESESVDSTGDYVRSGRKYQDLSSDNLAEQLTRALRATVKDFTNSACWRAHSDLFAEYALRDQPPPPSVSVELEQLFAIINLAEPQVKPRDTELRDRTVQRFFDFISRQKGPKN